MQLKWIEIQSLFQQGKWFWHLISCFLEENHRCAGSRDPIDRFIVFQWTDEELVLTQDSSEDKSEDQCGNATADKTFPSLLW